MTTPRVVFSRLLLVLAIMTLLVPHLFAQTAPSPDLELAPRLTHAAMDAAGVAAWDAGEPYRRGQRAMLAELPAPGKRQPLPVRVLSMPVEHAIQAAQYEVQRGATELELEQWEAARKASQSDPVEAAQGAQPALEKAPAPDPMVDQQQREHAAALALEEARKREAAERDVALKALIGRERAIAEETLQWTETFGQKLEAELAQNLEIEKQWTAFVEPLRTQIEDFDLSFSQVQRSERVDPVFAALIKERRLLWQATDTARPALERARLDMDTSQDAVDKAAAELQALAAQEGAATPLRLQRETVAKAALALAQAKHEGIVEREAALSARLQMQRGALDEASTLIRGLLPLVSSQTRSTFYDFFEAQNWRDAIHLLNDKLTGGRDRLRSRWVAASSMRDRLASVLLWLLALLPRLFLFVVAAFVLRFVPPLLRRGLDAALERSLFRTRPAVAIKLYELLRVSAKPALYLWAMSFVFEYITDAFPEVLALWGAVEAVFVFWIIDRLARTLFYARSRREERGDAARGGIDDLTQAESQMANLFMLDESIADRAVRSARLVVVLVIAWLWALDVLYALVGYSVLSFLVYWALVAAVFVVAFWALSAWREEVASLFGRMLGERAPGAQAFVDKHKDRFYGVAVIAGAALMVLVVEIARFAQKYLVGTGAFRRWNNFLFATKVELKTRYDEHRADLAQVPPETERYFLQELAHDEIPWIDRGLLPQLQAHYEAWQESARLGSVLVVGERGSGRTALLKSFVAQSDKITYQRAPAISTRLEALAMLREMFGIKEQLESVEEVIARIKQQEPRVLVLDDLERMFMRTVRGYGALLTLCRVISETDRQHFWMVSSARQAWSFLQRVHELQHNFAHIFTVPTWAGSELQRMLLERSLRAGIRVSFQALGSAATATDVVKTEEGYFRYLEEFTNGNPAAALHYWRQSLCATEAEDVDYGVQLFDRRHAAFLDRLSDRQRFLLNAILQHGDPSVAKLAVAINLSTDRVGTFVDLLDDAGVVEVDGQSVWLTRAWAPLVVRHLADSNLLVAQ